MKLYTIDRHHKLITNMKLELFTDCKYTDNSDIARGANQLVNSSFPRGITEHGNRYIFTSPNSESIQNYVCETVFELIRQMQFPNKLSRFQSVFATDADNLDNMISFIVNNQNFRIFELNCNRYEKYDMRWLSGNTFAVCAYNATQYWNGNISDDPLLEYLLFPPVIVGEQIIHRGTSR